MKWPEYIFLFINLLNSIFSVVPNWDFYNSAIDLLSSSSSYSFTIDGDNCQIEKIISKENDGSISYKKYLSYEGNTIQKDYEKATYYSTTVFGVSKLVCPRGKFQPYDLNNNMEIELKDFIGQEDWDLKCFNHQCGYFLIFYLNNKKVYLYYSYDSVSINKLPKWLGEELYDFIIEDGPASLNYKFKFTIIHLDNGNLVLLGSSLIMNTATTDKKFDKVNTGGTKVLIEAKDFSQAYFTSDKKVHFFTYSDVSNFLGGYSTSGVDFDDYSNINNIEVINHNFSPIEFLDEVEINKINFIPGTQYAYYEINDLNTKKTDHGFMDIKQNKVLFNTDENITTFVPYSNTEMLAITPNSAYKICIIKNGSSCLETCSNGNLILDTDGNKCETSSECDEGKIKLIPNDICINESLCDEKIFVKNDSHCGLCKEFYPNDNKYKLFNTSGCIGYIPNYTEQYNSNTYLNIFKCQKNFHPYNYTCVADFCFENCDICIEPSNDTNNQKCLTCKKGYYFDQNNCIKCNNDRCEECTKESNEEKLCAKCKSGYKTVNFTTKNPEFFYCLEEKEIPKKFYKEEKEGITVYKPCYRKCKSCIIGGNDQQNNCLECGPGYMFRPGDNPYNNCIGYSENIYVDSYGNIKNLPNPQCPDDAMYKIKDKDSNKVLCIYDCKASLKNRVLFNGNCLETCPENTTLDTITNICKVDKNRCSLGENDIYIENNDTMKVVETLAKTYMSEFKYTSKHIAKYNHQNFSVILYKNDSCIKAQNLRMPTIDFLNCSEVVKKAYNITELVAAIADRKSKKNPTSFFGFYHPVSGVKLDSDKLCNNSDVQITENLFVLLDENDKDYPLQISLAQQGVNIFDEDNGFFNDICFEFDNPLSRDIPLQDRQKNVFPQAELCDDGCHNQGIDLSEMTATCNCKYRDVSQSNLEPILDDLFGDVFELIDSSNLEVLRCHKNFFKYFPKSIGGIILLILIIADITFSVLFFTIELIKLKRYVLTLTDNYLAYLKDSQKKGKNPPKKNSDDTTNSMIKFMNLRNQKKTVTYQDNNKRPNSLISSNDVAIFKSKPNKDMIITGGKKKKKIKKFKKINSFFNLNDDKMDAKFFEEYLAPSVDDMAYDDAIVMDDRKYMEILCEIMKEKEMIMNTFVASDPLKGRFIKIILFILNICLYLVVNGFFFSEEYISELYNLEKEDNFFSFFPRSISKLIYTTIVSMVISYITDFFFLEEKKIIGLFRREKDNRHAIKEYIILFIKDLQNRYLSFIVIVFVILIFSFYYLVCFNRVYPKTQVEWIKSSIVIMIIVQIISVLKCLYETSMRVLSFRFKSERMYKASKIFD